MVGIVYDLQDNEAIYQGADWYKDFQLINPDTNLPYTLTDYSVRSMMRKSLDDLTETAEFTAVVVNESTGTIRISLTNSETAAIPAGTYKYDVEVVEPSPSSLVHKVVLLSSVQVIGEATK